MPSSLAIALLTVLPALTPERTDARAETARQESVQLSERIREQWLVSIEGFTRAPLDIGAQLGVQTPFGLRLFAGYGLVPDVYLGTLTSIAADATGDPRARLLLDSVEYSGRTIRVLLGLRPFPKNGLYVDAGYVNVKLRAARDIPDVLIPGVVLPRGGYRSESGLDLWTLELGYQVELARRWVLAAGLGVAGTIDATTSITPTGGAPNDPALLEGARQVDRAFERYGYVPTLTLRLGFDLI